MADNCEWCRQGEATYCVGCHHRCCDACLERCAGCPICGEKNLPYCEDCGLLSPPEMDEAINWTTQPLVDPEWGECCRCQIEGPAVRNALMMGHAGAIPGRGWGCLACGLPPIGIVVVLCDDCMELFKHDQSIVKFWCRGYPGKDGRRDMCDLPPLPFEHDLKNHPEIWR